MPDNTVTPIADRMFVEAAFEQLAAMRLAGQIVVTNQIAARLWPHYSNQPLDINYNPSTMGGAIPFALGLALAQPNREILVVSGEGALLMSLGSLVSVVASRATNLTVVALDNGSYEVTGGQRTPATGNPVDLAGIAEAAGFQTTARFSQQLDWSARGPKVLASAGPRFVWLEVQRCQRPPQPAPGPSLQEQIKQLSALLETT